MGKNAAYAAQYAEEAKEQMRMYGIPASVILAQAILESSNGQSQLSRECNNHFGIKAFKALNLSLVTVISSFSSKAVSSVAFIDFDFFLESSNSM